MHLPPAVSYEVVRSKWQFLIAFALAALAVSAATLFWMQQAGAGRATIVAGAAGICGMLPFILWRRTATGLLQWDGAHWLWSGFYSDPVQHVRLCLDLQGFLLVQLRSAQGQTVWLFLEERHDRPRWLALRRAVVARGRGDANQRNGSGVSQEAAG